MSSASLRSPLNELQLELLEAFAGVEGVWLSGGAALGGLQFGHRGTEDLDFFTADPSRLDELEHRLRDWCLRHHCTHEVERRYPGFQRHKVSSGGQSTLLDFVLEPVAQVVPLDQKMSMWGVRVDPPEEIRANKLAALLGRGETKDLVDLFWLEARGFDALEGLADATLKDGAVDAATLAWVLETMTLDLEGLLLVEPLAHPTLESYRDELVQRLKKVAFPG